MKRNAFITLLILLCLLTLIFCSCTNSNEEELKNALASFDSSEQYVFISERDFHVGNRITKLSDITYEGNPCHMISPETNGMYAYSAESNSDVSIDIVYIEFDTLKITLVKSLLLPETIITANLINDTFYFRMHAPESEESDQIYFLYDKKTDQTSTICTDDYIEYVERSDREYEHYYNFERFSLTTIGVSSVFNKHFDGKLYITDNQTGTTKLLDDSLLDTCEEGKIIRSFDGHIYKGCAYEKNGYVYLLFTHDTDVFGDDNYFIMKYDFETHTLEYYAAIWNAFTDDTCPYMFIP